MHVDVVDQEACTPALVRLDGLVAVEVRIEKNVRPLLAGLRSDEENFVARAAGAHDKRLRAGQREAEVFRRALNGDVLHEVYVVDGDAPCGGNNGDAVGCLFEAKVAEPRVFGRGDLDAIKVRVVEVDLECGAGDRKRFDANLREAMRRRDLFDDGVCAAAKLRVVAIGEWNVERERVARHGSDGALGEDVRSGPMLGLAIAVGQIHTHESDVRRGDAAVDTDRVSSSETGGAGDLDAASTGRNVNVGGQRGGMSCFGFVGG